MDSLEDVYAGASRWGAVARAVLLLASSLVAAIGFVAATASLVAGFGLGKSEAFEVAAMLGAVFLLAVFLFVFVSQTPDDPTRTLAGIGVTVAVGGLALFWSTLPGEWSGRLDQLPLLGIGAYAAGLVAVFGAGFAARTADDERTGPDAAGPRPNSARSRTGTLGSSRSPMTVGGDDGTDADSRVATVGGGAEAEHAKESSSSNHTFDGGEDGDDLQFFDEDRS